MAETPCKNHGLFRVLMMAFGAALLGVLIAGFWNYHLVDGFGKQIVAGEILGNTEILSQQYATYGAGLGLLFGAVAGLAATFTACNCVVFVMLPGLACSTESGSPNISAGKAIGIFVTGVLLVSALYGFYVGNMGPEAIETYNEHSNRLLQAQFVFTGLGVIMLIWGIFELGIFGVVPGFSGDNTLVKAGMLGLMVGLFSVGRPFPVFRDFLTYAASSNSPFYGAVAMMMQGLGQIAVMVLLFGLLFWFAGLYFAEWALKTPSRPMLISGLALLTGGSFFVFYWGLAFTFDIGQWGFKLGWY